MCSHMGTLLQIHSIQRVPLGSHLKCQNHSKSEDEISQMLQKVGEAPISSRRLRTPAFWSPCNTIRNKHQATMCVQSRSIVKNYPKIQVLIWVGGIYPTSPGGPREDQFAHLVPHFPNGKEAKCNRKMCEDYTLKTWK